MSNADIFRALSGAFNARAFDRAYELVSGEFEFEDVAAGVTVHGPDGFIDYARGWAGAFSDMQIEVLAVVADESRVAGEFVGRGTHDGTLPTPAGELPATGRRFEERFIWFGEVSGGKLTGVRDYYNAMSMMTQLGLMPEAAEAG